MHAFQEADPEIGRHLNFIKYLIQHPEVAEQYSNLKADLARRFSHDIESYVNGKSDFVKSVDVKAELLL